MSKLQKTAWVNLIVASVGVVVMAACFYILTAANAKGFDYLVIFVVAGSPGGLAAFLHSRKKGFEAGLDERERAINRRAFIWAAYVLTIFLAVACIIPFFVLGGQAQIPVYTLPALFVGALFITQFVHSAAILVISALEEEDGS